SGAPGGPTARLRRAQHARGAVARSAQVRPGRNRRVVRRLERPPYAAGNRREGEVHLHRRRRGAFDPRRDPDAPRQSPFLSPRLRRRDVLRREATAADHRPDRLPPGRAADRLMRLWTVHPRYLDPQGLVALWREALLARAVLRGETKGYRHHP